MTKCCHAWPAPQAWSGAVAAARLGVRCVASCHLPLGTRYSPLAASLLGGWQMKHDNLLRCNAAAVSSSTKIVASYKPYANIKCCPQLIWPDSTTDAAACAGFDGPRAINLNISGIICAERIEAGARCSKIITEVAFRGVERRRLDIVEFLKYSKYLFLYIYSN